MARSRVSPPAHGAEDGFTLIEVIVSLAVLSVVATASLYFFITGTQTISHQQRAQNAVAVATEAMELAYAVTTAPDPATHVMGLVKGRTQADVQSAWSQAGSAGTEGLTDTYPVWDTTASGSQPEAVQLTRDVTLSKMPYTVTTLIGVCYRSVTAAAGAAAPCTTVAGVPTAPAATPLGFARMVRVMVVVDWLPTSGTCDAGTCRYQLSALVDPSQDLVWNNTSQPVAVDDAVVVDVGQSTTVDVLTNDIIGPVTTNPVQKVLVKTGTGTATPLGNGKVTFTAPSNASGYMSFTYSLKDAQGRESNTATVRVAVMPKAINDTARLAKTDTLLIPVTANDLGSPATLTVTPPAGGVTAVPEGIGVRFDPQGRTGTFTFTYSYADTSGLVSNSATVTVTVTEFRDPMAGDYTVVVPVTSSASSAPLDMLALTGNPAGYLFEVMDITIAKGKLIVGANEFSPSNRTSPTLGYNQQGNEPGIYTFRYRVTPPDGSVASEIKTITLNLVPQPVNDSFAVATGSTTKLNLGANDAPTNFGGSTQFTPSFSPPSCSGGSIAQNSGDLQNGIVDFKAPSGPATCTFTYTISGTGALSALVSAPATVTVTVTQVAKPPVANPDPSATAKRSTWTWIEVGMNDVPTGPFADIETRNVSCGASFDQNMEDRNGGRLRYRSPNRGSCSFEYRLSGIGASAGWSNWTTVNVTVSG